MVPQALKEPLISYSYVFLIYCHGRGRGFEPRRPATIPKAGAVTLDVPLFFPEGGRRLNRVFAEATRTWVSELVIFFCNHNKRYTSAEHLHPIVG